MIKPEQLVECFQRFLKEERGYVFGAQGELYSPELAAKWKAIGRSVPGGRVKSTYFTRDCAKWYGHLVDDCSGGIVDAVRQFEPKFTDRTANGFFSQCTRSGRINTIPEIPGLCLWRKGHIGVYEGNGYGIEFRGTNYGCVRTRVAARNWSHWGMLACVDYNDSPAPDTGWKCSRLLKLKLPRMRGGDVLQLQNALLEKGFSPGDCDGIYGPQTFETVKTFQMMNGLSVDGKAGRQTITALGGRWE